MQVELEQLEDNKYWMTVAIYQKQANGPTDLLHDFQRVIYRDEFIRSWCFNHLWKDNILLEN